MISLLNEQIERLSGIKFRRLGFPAQLEESFEEDTRKRRSLRLALEGLFAIALFDLFVVLYDLISPSELHGALVVRLGIITPLALLINYRLWRNPGKVFRESSMVAAACLAGLSHLALESNISAVNSAYAQVGLLIVIVYANTAARLRFQYALVSTLILLAGDVVFLVHDRLLQVHEKLLGFGIVGIAIAISVIANYSSNREERLSYLLGKRGDLLLVDLHQSNERLTDMAAKDALTGLTNRLGFNSQFKKLWREALNAGTSFSVVMVDVDHFKRLNDSYGHPYGDKVLKRIAHLILEALRREQDFAARYGGEEFVLLLPDTSQEAAMMVAERLRNLVHLSGFPPIDVTRPLEQDIAAVGATVSCGVATTIPRTLEERHQLLAAADKALYDAKAKGRNCVERRLFERRARASSFPLATM